MARRRRATTFTWRRIPARRTPTTSPWPGTARYGCPSSRLQRSSSFRRAGKSPGQSNLSSYDTDGNPDADAIAIVDTPAGEKAFVALDRLNPYPTSVQPSWMLRIDVATATVEAHVPLAGLNPFGSMQLVGTDLWLAEPGNFDDATEATAGIERFDTSTSTSELVIHEADLGGSVAQVSVTSGCGVAIVADATPNVNATSLATFESRHGCRRGNGVDLASRNGRVRPRGACLERRHAPGRGSPACFGRIPGPRVRRRVLAGRAPRRRVPTASADRHRTLTAFDLLGRHAQCNLLPL